MAPIKWDPLARCPIFERTLAFLGYSPEVMRCVQRYLGSGLLGRQIDKKFAAFIGPKDSGKSTLLGTAQKMLGAGRPGKSPIASSYGTVASFSAFVRPETGNTPELAQLVGARLAVINEIPKLKELGSSVVKEWTGDMVITATPKHHSPIKFLPQATLCFVGNFVPKLPSEDGAVWGRLLLFVSPNSIPEDQQDKFALDRINLSAALNWFAQGARDALVHGLAVPEECVSEREDRREQAAEDEDGDPILRALVTNIERCDRAWLTTEAVADASAAAKTPPDAPLTYQRLSRRAVVSRLTAKLGPVSKRSEGVRGWRGFRFRGDPLA